jgi:hypothetical protein
MRNRKKFDAKQAPHNSLSNKKKKTTPRHRLNRRFYRHYNRDANVVFQRFNIKTKRLKPASRNARNRLTFVVAAFALGTFAVATEKAEKRRRRHSVD